VARGRRARRERDRTLRVAPRARRATPKHCAHHASTRARKAALTRRELIARTPGPSHGQGATPRGGTAATRAEAASRWDRGRGRGRGHARQVASGHAGAAMRRDRGHGRAGRSRDRGEAARHGRPRRTGRGRALGRGELGRVGARQTRRGATVAPRQGRGRAGESHAAWGPSRARRGEST
jgi:hypothetical protein